MTLDSLFYLFWVCQLKDFLQIGRNNRKQPGLYLEGHQHRTANLLQDISWIEGCQIIMLQSSKYTLLISDTQSIPKMEHNKQYFTDILVSIGLKWSKIHKWYLLSLVHGYMTLHSQRCLLFGDAVWANYQQWQQMRLRPIQLCFC